MPTTIDQEDPNSDLDERTIDYLFLKGLPPGTLSIKLPFLLPVDAIASELQSNHCLALLQLKVFPFCDPQSCA